MIDDKKLPKTTADEPKLVFETPHTSRRYETRRAPTSKSSCRLVCGGITRCFTNYFSPLPYEPSYKQVVGSYLALHVPWVHFIKKIYKSRFRIVIIVVSTSEYLNRFWSGLLEYELLSTALPVILNTNRDYPSDSLSIQIKRICIEIVFNCTHHGK